MMMNDFNLDMESTAASENEPEVDTEVETSACVNCCQSLNRVLEIESDFNNLNIFESLSSIYKLDYLTAFIDSSPSLNPLLAKTTTIKLCDNCLQVFRNLYQFYNDFNQLRSLDSWLAKEINKLDECIQAHDIIRRIKKEPGAEDVQYYTSEHENEGIEEEEQQQINERLIIHPGPWVVIQKLENDPIAQTALALSTRKKRGRKRKAVVDVDSTIDDNYEEDQGNFNNNDDDYAPDIDFCPTEDMEMEDYEEDAEQIQKTTKGRISKKPSKKSTKILSTTIKKKPKPTGKSNKSKIKSKLKASKSSLRKAKRNANKNKSSTSSESKQEEETIKGKPESRAQRKRLDYLYRKRKLKTPNPCWYCDLYFDTPAECFSHTQKEHLQPGHNICKACSNIQTTKTAAGYHEKLCASYKPGQLLPPFKCDECSAEFAIQYYLKCHKNSYHHGRGLLTCQFCGFQTPRTTTFKTHMTRSHVLPEEPIEARTCQICENRTYKNRYSLESHMKKMHSEDGMQKYKAYQQVAKERKKIAKASRPPKSFVCTDCNVDCFTNLALVLHRKNFHFSNFAHVCDKCGAGFAGPNNLKYHIKYVHTEVRPFFCDQCGATFKTSGHLREHARNTHSEEGRLKYNAMMRQKKLRRKARDMALAQSRAQREEGEQQQQLQLPSASSSFSFQSALENVTSTAVTSSASTFSTNASCHPATMTTQEHSSQNPLNFMNMNNMVPLATFLSQSQQIRSNPQLP